MTNGKKDGKKWIVALLIRKRIGRGKNLKIVKNCQKKSELHFRATPRMTPHLMPYVGNCEITNMML